MENFYRALYSIPFLCFFVLFWTPGQFSLSGPYLGFCTCVLGLLGISSLILTVAGCLAILTAVLSRQNPRALIIAVAFAALPGICAIFLVSSPRS